MDTFRGRSRTPQYAAQSIITKHPQLEDSCPQTWRVAFHEVPIEIALLILDELSDEDLFACAYVSKILNCLSIRLYLCRKGFGSLPNEQLALFNFNARECLRALGVTLFKPRLYRLCYALDLRKSVEELHEGLRVLEWAAERLESVHELVVSFQDVPKHSTDSTDQDPGEQRRVYGLTAALCNQLTTLLDRLIQSGRCASLSVSNSFVNAPASAEVQNAMAQHFGALWGAKEVVSRRLRKLSRSIPSLRSHPAARANGLQAFKLHSRMVFHPELCRWTIDTLNNSPCLTSLSITNSYTLSDATWATVLPCISIPTLTSFTLDCVSLSTQDLFTFLHRHSTIECLYIGRHVSGPDIPNAIQPQTKLQKSMLRNLSHLIAPLKWIPLLLAQGCPSGHAYGQKQKPELVLPSLNYVKILLHFINTQHFSFKLFNRTLEPVSQRLTLLKQLHIALTFGSPLTDWMSTNTEHGHGTPSNGHNHNHSPARASGGPGSRSASGNHKDLQVGLGLIMTPADLETALPSPPTPPTQIQTDIPNPFDNLKAHSLVTQLELYTRTYAVPRWVTAKIPKWLGAQSFGSLRRFVFVSPGPSETASSFPAGPGHGYGGGTYSPFSRPQELPAMTPLDAGHANGGAGHHGAGDLLAINRNLTPSPNQLVPSSKDAFVRNVADVCPGVEVEFKALDDVEFPVLLGF